MKLWFRSIFIINLVLILTYASSLWAAACCGGGFAAPSIIAGDDKAQLTSTVSYSQVVVDSVNSRGIWRSGDEHQQVRTFRLEGAHIFSDRWQLGFSLPVIQRSFMGKSYSGLGDAATSIGYEYLPDWDYDLYRPKGIGYLQVTLPTGMSPSESEVGGLDSRGNGFLAIGVGTLLTKAIDRWDAMTSFEIHRSFEKHYSNSQVSGNLKPGFGGIFSMGGGYNLRSWRYGTAITWTYEDPIRIQGANSGIRPLERYATGTFSLSYMASERWAGTLSYSDQTLFGNPVNTSLGRTLALQLQRRWGR